MSTYTQARNQGGETYLQNFSPPLEKFVGHSLKILDIVQKNWPLSENSSPLVVSQAGYGPAYTKRSHHCTAFIKYGHYCNCRELRNVDIIIVMKYYQILTFFIKGSLAQNWSFCCKNQTWQWDRSKLYKGSNIGKDDKNELKKPELITSGH